MGASILPWEKSLLIYLKEALSDDTFSPELMDAFSLLLNKTEHFNYFIQNNISSEELMLANYYGAMEAFQNVDIFKKLHLEKLIGLPIQLCKKNFMHSTPHLKIADVLKDTPHVVAIIGTGSNDEMRMVGNNPFSIMKDLKNREKTPHYNYTYEKAMHPDMLPTIMQKVQKNLEMILNARQGKDMQVYMLSQFIPRSLENKSMVVFQKLILEYNQRLQELCQNYHVGYVDQMQIVQNHNTGKFNFHPPKAGIKTAAYNILDQMYENIGIENTHPYQPIETFDDGAQGILYNVEDDYWNTLNQANQMPTHSEMEEYAKERIRMIAAEHANVCKVLKKVIKDTK